MSRKRTLKERQEDIRTLTRVPSEFIHAKLDELAEEVGELGNPGWIPCSERLPDKAFGCLVTVMDGDPYTEIEFENVLPYHVGYDSGRWNDADGEEIPFEVIAWMPLPKPHREG